MVRDVLVRKILRSEARVAASKESVDVIPSKERAVLAILDVID